jgi:hypothetical protein
VAPEPHVNLGQAVPAPPTEAVPTGRKALLAVFLACTPCAVGGAFSILGAVGVGLGVGALGAGLGAGAIAAGVVGLLTWRRRRACRV